MSNAQIWVSMILLFLLGETAITTWASVSRRRIEGRVPRVLSPGKGPR